MVHRIYMRKEVAEARAAGLTKQARQIEEAFERECYLMEKVRATMIATYLGGRAIYRRADGAGGAKP